MTARKSTWLLLVALTAFVRPSLADDPVPLRVGITPDMPPVIFKEAGKPAGIEADFAKLLGEKLGRPIQFVEVKWEDQITALTDGRTDIIMSSMSITPARQVRVAFSKPYLIIGQMPLVRRADAARYARGFPAQPSGTIGVVKATTGDFLVQQEFPKNRRKAFHSAADAAAALVKKQIDLFICDMPVVWWQAGLHEADGLVVVPIPLSEEHLAWGVRRSDREFLDQVNTELDLLQSSGKARSIIKHWIPFSD